MDVFFYVFLDFPKVSYFITQKVSITTFFRLFQTFVFMVDA